MLTCSFEDCFDDFYCHVRHSLGFPACHVRLAAVGGFRGAQRGQRGTSGTCWRGLRGQNRVVIPCDFTPLWVLAVSACSLFQLFLLIKKPNWSNKNFQLSLLNKNRESNVAVVADEAGDGSCHVWILFLPYAWRVVSTSEGRGTLRRDVLADNYTLKHPCDLGGRRSFCF